MYGYIPIENASQLKQSYLIANATDWQFEKAGKRYGGVEESEFSQAQKAELVGLGGGWFATREEFGQWLAAGLQPAPFLFEVVISTTRKLVCNLPTLTDGASFVLDVTVRDAGQPERNVQLLCTNAASISTAHGPMPEFDFLVSAIRSDAGLNTLTTQMLHLRNQEGVFD